MPTLSKFWRSFLNSPTALLFTLLLIGLIGICGLLTNSARQENLEYRTRLQSQVATGSVDQAQRVGEATRAYAVWNAFSAKANQTQTDKAWLQKNLTSAIYDNLNIDITLLIDPATHQILYGIRKHTVLAYPANVLQLSPSEWRWIDSAMSHPRGASSFTAHVNLDHENQHFVQQLYLIAVHPVVPEQNRPIKHGKLLLFARMVDPSLLQALSRSYHIKAPSVQFSAPTNPGLMSQAISGVDGRTIAYLTWKADAPGDALLSRLAPGAITLCMLLLLLGLLLGQLSQRLLANQKAILRRLRRQGEVLRSITKDTDGQGNSLQKLQEMCQQLAQVLDTDRVGIWRHDADNRKLLCIASSSQGERNQSIQIEASPAYLQQLELERFICIPDLTGTENTNSYNDYIKKHQVRSILDATIRVGKQTHGIIGAECGRTRRWTQDEINFVCAAADCVALITESTARQTAEGELSSLFYYDRGTGLPNGNRFRLQLNTLTSARNARAGACVLMDLSNLGNVIEAYGNPIGELLVLDIAKLIETQARPGEMAARLNETLFALWLEGDSIEDLTNRLNHLQHALLDPFHLDGQSIHPRFQIGTSLFPEDGHDADSLMENARSAVQFARNLNNQSWVRFNSGQILERRERHRLQMQLREALELKQLHVQYQPFIELAQGNVIGAEALLRWTHPERGSIPPAIFIPLAEEDDKLINDIGAWILDQSCAQIALWRRDFSPELRMSINVSVKQMEAEGFHQLVADTLKRHCLPACAIELEITESIALSGTAELEINLKALQHQGIQLAIDDFGTGYATFNYLHRFPAAQLKIDRQFFDQVPGNLQNSNLVKMIVAMGHAMGAQVIGEGVEQAEQVAFLKQVGGDIAQGYFFSRPLDPEAMEAFLQGGPYPV